MTPRPLKDKTAILSPCLALYRSLGLAETEAIDVAPNQMLGRVTIVHGARLEVITCDATGTEVTQLCTFPGEINVRPVTGDWVSVLGDHVTRVLPRRSTLRRPDPSGRDIQVLAANLDLVLIVVPINRGLNVRMLERIAVMAYDSGAQPLIILTKSDEADGVLESFEEANMVVPGVEILTTSARSGAGIESLREQLHTGITAVMLGPSGAGKTSLLNALESRDEFTLDVSRGGEGRHATSTRRLYRLRSGGVLLDIPGIRLVDLLVGQDGIDETFSDIETLSAQCRFRDCLHDKNQDCAVQNALTRGTLSSQRYERWRAIRAELGRREPHPRRRSETLSRRTKKRPV